MIYMLKAIALFLLQNLNRYAYNLHFHEKRDNKIVSGIFRWVYLIRREQEIIWMKKKKPFHEDFITNQMSIKCIYYFMSVFDLLLLCIIFWTVLKPRMLEKTKV